MLRQGAGVWWFMVSLVVLSYHVFLPAYRLLSTLISLIGFSPWGTQKECRRYCTLGLSISWYSWCSGCLRTIYVYQPPPSSLKYCTSINLTVSATSFSSENHFQAPNKRTPRQLQGLNIEKRHLPASAIVKNANLPRVDGPCMLTPCASFPAILICYQYSRPWLTNKTDAKSLRISRILIDRKAGRLENVPGI